LFSTTAAATTKCHQQIVCVEWISGFFNGFDFF
jgi:hypothetical protein